MTLTLKGLVISKYGTATKFSEAMGWSVRKGCDIVSGRRKASIKDMERIAEALQIHDQKMFCDLFFNGMSTLWQNDET